MPCGLTDVNKPVYVLDFYCSSLRISQALVLGVPTNAATSEVKARRLHCASHSGAVSPLFFPWIPLAVSVNPVDCLNSRAELVEELLAWVSVGVQ